MGAVCKACKGDPKSYDLEAREAKNIIHPSSESQAVGAETAENTAPEEHGTSEQKISNEDGLSASHVKGSACVDSEDSEKERESFQKKSDKALESQNTTVAENPKSMSSSEEFKPGHASQRNEVGVKAGHASSTNEPLFNFEAMSDEDIERTVDECWRKIEESSETPADDVMKVASTSASAWRVVRLFVSSTFADYHAEREVLVKKVFPELREWCEGRHIQLIECDLRWGVPKYSTTETTIKICLGEIDRCKEEMDGVPFFLNMLGERYGWMPSVGDIPEEIRKDYNLVFPTSVTHMEIVHAAYRSRNPNAAFLIRDPAFLDNIPSQMRGAFIDDANINKAHLQRLKEKLREKFPGQVMDYSCEYDGIDDSTGKSKVCLKGLEEFGDAVLRFFKSAIEKTFPVIEQELSPHQIELSAHENFILARGAWLLGRASEVSDIMGYIKTGRLPGHSTTDCDEVVTPMLLVQGVSGSGKSALMANCTLQAKQLGCPLFYHFVGSGPGSASPLRMANRLFNWLKELTKYTGHIEESDNDKNDDDDEKDISLEEIPKHMKNVVVEAGKLDKDIIIILDAVNQLFDGDRGSGHLKWLPTGYPSNVRVIVSAVYESRSVNILLHEDITPRPLELVLGELDRKARQEIVEHILGIYNKKLDAHQMNLLVSMEGACNPLWLSLACEELRVFGVFERVTDHISSLPGYLKGLLQFILHRFVAEDEYNNVEKVLCVLECMKGGLDETELRWILSDEPSTEPSAEPMPMIKWAVVRRTLKPFLRRSSDHKQEERLDFFHASISEVVKDSLLTDAQQTKSWHLRIADYFQYRCKDDWRASEIVPQQLKEAGNKKRLLDFLKTDVRARRKNSVWKNQYYKFLVCGQIIPQIKGFSEEVAFCQMCSMMHKGLGQLAGLNRDCCVTCGGHVPWKQDKYVAMLCQRHKPFMAPGQKKCFICERPAFQNSQRGYTCMICTSLGIKKCVKCVV